MVLATAGHVDHGKTSLIRALTGTDTDRLPDEKRRGISIELGFAELPERGISFIDVPGHKKLVHAMISGVGGVDGALVAVAADDGVMPQTREHLHVLSLLGIRRVVVALTKADLVDAEMLELAEADVRGTLDAIGLECVALVATAMPSGSGIPELTEALVELARRAPVRAASRRLWLPIDRVFSVKGAGTVVTGTLSRGELGVGQTVYLAQAGGLRESVCRGLEVHGRSLEKISAPARVAVNVKGLEVADVARGDVLTFEAMLPLSTRLDILLTPLGGSERALGDGSPVTAHVGTTRRGARVFRIGDGLYHLVLDEPLPSQGGVGLVLRGFASTREHGAVLGGGRILAADAPPLPKKRDAKAWELRRTALAKVAEGDFSGALAELMWMAAPRPVIAADVERRFGLEPGEIGRWLTGKKRRGPADALSLANGEAFTLPGVVEALAGELEAALARHHGLHPHEPGLSLETLRASFSARAGRECTELALARSQKDGRVRVEAGIACLSTFAESSGPQAREARERVLEVIDQSALTGVSDAAVAARLPNERPEVVKSALARLASDGLARRLTGLWFAERHLEALREKVRTYFVEHPVLSVPTFKDLAGISRKQAIPLLEQLDREGTTRRQGDDRVRGAGKG